MKTINQIQIEANLNDRQSVYYRLKVSGIEEKKDYLPQYTRIEGKLVRIFTDEESEILINCSYKKTKIREKEEVSI